jgi:hypothetical protein
LDFRNASIVFSGNFAEYPLWPYSMNEVIVIYHYIIYYIISTYSIY